MWCKSLYLPVECGDIKWNSRCLLSYDYNLTEPIALSSHKIVYICSSVPIFITITFYILFFIEKIHLNQLNNNLPQQYYILYFNL